jgi:hypothetical protein
MFGRNLLPKELFRKGGEKWSRKVVEYKRYRGKKTDEGGRINAEIE